MSISNYTLIAQGIETILAGLALPGEQTLLQKFPSDRAAAGVVLPSQQVTLGPASERAVGSLNQANDWEYPYLVTFMQPADQDYSWDTAWLTWRRQVELAFHNLRPMPSVANNPIFRVEPSAISDPGQIHDSNLNVGQLMLWARQREDRLAPPSTASFSGGNLIYASVGEAVQAAIQAIGLAGVANGQVVLLKDWLDRQSLTINLGGGPVILVAHARKVEKEVGPMLGKDDWLWPLVVTILRSSDQSLTWDDSWFLMRQQIRDAFHNQSLLAVKTALWCEVEPGVICDPGPWHDQQVDVGQLIIRTRSRESRG